MHPCSQALSNLFKLDSLTPPIKLFKRTTTETSYQWWQWQLSLYKSRNSRKQSVCNPGAEKILSRCHFFRSVPPLPFESINLLPRPHPYRFYVSPVVQLHSSDSDSSSIVMGDSGSFVRVMRCTADIKPVLPSWGSRCCVCASNFPSNLFLPSSLGGTCTYRRCWWREKRCSDGGRENGAAAAANKRIRRWRSLGRLLESSSGGFRLSSPIHSFTPPHAFCTLLQGITRYTSAFNCFFADAARRRYAEERRRWFRAI